MPSVHRCSTQKPVFFKLFSGCLYEPIQPWPTSHIRLFIHRNIFPLLRLSGSRLRLLPPASAARSLALRPIFGPFRRTSAVTGEPISANRGVRRRGRVGSRFERSARKSHWVGRPVYLLFTNNLIVSVCRLIHIPSIRLLISLSREGTWKGDLPWTTNRRVSNQCIVFLES